MMNNMVNESCQRCSLSLRGLHTSEGPQKQGQFPFWFTFGEVFSERIAVTAIQLNS